MNEKRVYECRRCQNTHATGYDGDYNNVLYTLFDEMSLLSKGTTHEGTGEGTVTITFPRDVRSTTIIC